MSKKSPDFEVIYRAALSGEGSVIKSLCRYVLRYDMDNFAKRIAALELRVGVEETRTSRSITNWASAGYPGILERAERAEARAEAADRALRMARAEINAVLDIP